MADRLEARNHLLVLFERQSWQIVQFNNEPENIYVIHKCDKGDCLISTKQKGAVMEKTCWGCHIPVPDDVTTIREMHNG